MPSRGSALLARHRRNLTLLIRFGVVGVSGVVVNMITLILLRKLGPHFDDAVVGLGTSDFNLRWYHVYSTIAFLVANLSNFQLNRTWTFQSSRASAWWKEYWPFLVVGLGGQAIGLAMLTLLMHPHSPVSLPTSVFDDSSGLRNRLYWSQLIVIGLITPLSFVLNKLWTFAAVRTGRPGLADPLREEEVLAEEEVV
ncbi:Putative flippase GtrA (transmembrane translocase of bactoprenol-linked glucose) [Nocardioides exalbidus]|uniref:Putative flippase GtrA (Transmembrane translocase of bactoprenol-linked glucose) n=1 Tax=Nocardioides exalbidus TaxID=402596 RepID=A0A1H4VJ27_9ACTN|nr:GtrA family protein [Nocardioides exalbidus]SEC80344.1 Putative flippase GtrA (transmembrane translocase of bactoprenol-linked glucose) [Nocardioides exalbidus]